MVQTLRHRGPDGDGVVTGPGWGFGHARLSIIDLAGGAQPMDSACGELCITFNGEIYNYRELRRELGELGARFETESDTEVLLAGYRIWGEAIVDRLNGMFAFAIWDRTRARLFAARDRVGIKPFYYAVLGRNLAFASEPKALLEVAGVSRQLNPVALDAYLDLAYVPPPLSMFRGLLQLPPGHVLRWSSGELEVHRYWDAPPKRPQRRSLEEWAETVEPVLVDAVRKRLIADVPVGAFLSGGLDSSTIVAIASENRAEPLQTFSIGYGAEGSSYDERAQARELANAFGTKHHELVLGSQTIDGVAGVVEAFDEPFGSPTSLLSHAISKFARTNVKVALAGDGGDEVFGGYPRYRGMGLSSLAAMVPRCVSRSVRRLVGSGATHRARDYRRWAGQFLDGLAMPASDRYASWVGYATEPERDRMLSDAVIDQLTETGRTATVRDSFDGPRHGDAIARASYADLHGFLPENVLRCSDRMSMATGLEVRVPFCDHRLVELASTVPAHRKVGVLTSKRILRRIAKKRLPPSVLRRRKLGFNGPMGAWIRGAVREIRREWLSPEAISARGLLRPSTVGRFLDEHEAGTRDHSLRLWSLIVLEQWHRTYVDA